MNKSNYKFKTGLVVGKFYPPHRGHKHLIETALSQCEKVTALVCWKASETISGIRRANWLKEIHPSIEVKLLDDSKLADDDSKGWASYTVKILGFIPEGVFTSEDYGDHYARFMGSVHVLVDKKRVTIPISATKVRGNPMFYAQYLEPNVRSYFARRIVILGAESTGTTTLARDLAKYYKTVWVPEFGRFYSEGRMHTELESQWRSEEFTTIAKGQIALEDKLAEASNGLVICDTDAFATSIWHERYMATLSKEVEHLAHSQSYDLYIVTGDEIPWEDDGTRDGKGIRHWMHERFISKLKEHNKLFIIVSGDRQKRLEDAVKAIDQLGNSKYGQE